MKHGNVRRIFIEKSTSATKVVSIVTPQRVGIFLLQQQQQLSLLQLQWIFRSKNDQSSSWPNRWFPGNFIHLSASATKIIGRDDQAFVGLPPRAFDAKNSNSRCYREYYNHARARATRLLCNPTFFCPPFFCRLYYDSSWIMMGKHLLLLLTKKLALWEKIGVFKNGFAWCVYAIILKREGGDTHFLL